MQTYGSPFSSKSLMSPRTHRTSASSSRRSSILPGLKKIPTRYSVSGRSNQSAQVVCKTPYHVVESFGAPLPVLVTEALTFLDRNTNVSVSLSGDGWAWFVCGRRLLIWQYKQPVEVGKQRHFNSHCHELTLPASDLAHKAGLVAVFTSEGNLVPSCIAVSPEGTVRYWPSISHEGASVEDNADLQGQECYSLTNIAPIGCVLATTTSTILLVEPQIMGGRHAVTCRMLKMPHGWLGGIGRKVSSLIFGSLPTTQVMETKLVRVAAASRVGCESKAWFVFVLAEHSLQKWLFCLGEVERLVFECDVNRMVREVFHETVWESCAGSNNELDIWMLDMRPTEGDVMLLVAAVNTQLSNQLHYALGKLSTDNIDAPTKFTSFCALKYHGFYKEDNESELLGFQILLVGQAAYLYNKKLIVAVSATNCNDEPDIIEFMGSGDRLLGGSLSGNVPVVFSKIHGLVSVSPSDITPHDLLNSSVSFSDLPSGSDVTVSQFSDGGVNIVISDVELHELSINKDSVARIRAAFIHFIKNHKDLTQCEEIVRDLFPLEEDPVNEVDAVLDTIAVKMSQDLVNDTPSSDPRWAEVKTSGVSIGYTSLQILHQLEDKRKALEWYILFLKEIKLWERFGAVTCSSGVMSTSYVLGEHAEKIVAAIALRKLQSNYGAIIDSAIKNVLAEQNIKPIGGLSHQDIFYKEVNSVHRFLQVLAKWLEELVYSDRQPQEVVLMLADGNTVTLSVLQEVIQFRQQKAEIFSPTSTLNPDICEYVPWTAAPGDGGLRDALTLQQDVTLKHGARSTGDIVLKNRLYDQVVNLVDIILDGRKCQIESLRGTRKFDGMLQLYEKERLSIIQPLLDDEEYERAAILAEKYCDFQILIQICDLTENKARLDQYMEKFAEQNFSQFLFRWYIREQKQGKLLGQFRTKEKPRGQQQALAQFLGEHPSLSWLQNVFSGNYREASITLQNLAKEETELIRRKKSMLSLAKLALLASEEHPKKMEEQVEYLNSQLDLVQHEEELPEHVLTAFGYDLERLRVLTPVELIKILISDENEGASAFEFKKALDLLAYIEDEFERSELKHTIWCQAILHDSWTETVIESPVEVIQRTIFFKLVDLMVFVGGNPEEFLPSLERLLVCQELGTLITSSNFQYLLKVGYEYVQRTLHTQ